MQRVGDKNAERLRYLAQIGITPGAAVRVIARAPFEGPIVLRVLAPRVPSTRSARRWRGRCSSRQPTAPREAVRGIAAALPRANPEGGARDRDSRTLDAVR